MLRCLSLLPIAAAAAAAAQPGAVVYAGGGWAAIDRGSVCEAVSRSLKVAPKDKVQAVAGFAFTADRRRWGEFHARLSRIPRAGSSVILTIGRQPFLLVTRGDWAWSTGAEQQHAIIEAIRAGGWMKVESRDSAGGRFTDPYLTDGAATAIDSAAARCALRAAGKIR
ncbi:MAG TPA: hypothetical protein VFW39_07840 [Sphingomicrobium sp.]|nr:hypothetical protein [Sphingomicrobium sp.]